MNEKLKMYKCKNLLWEYSLYDLPRAHCPIDRCELNVEDFFDVYDGNTHFSCPKCDFTLDKEGQYENIRMDIHKIIQSDNYKDAEIINIDGEIIKVGKEKLSDSDYWIETSISKNIKGVKQLMVLVGSKKEVDKTQLFLDIDNEKLSFDQNNEHPKKLLAKVTATFKNTTSIIKGK